MATSRASTDHGVRRSIGRAAVALLLALTLPACGDEGGEVDAAPGGATDSSADGGAGAGLYAESCALCHGADLRGSAMGPSHLSQVYESGHHSDDSFRSAIANGSPQHHWDFGAMPPVPGLDDDEVDSIIAYVRAQQREHGLEPYPPG